MRVLLTAGPTREAIDPVRYLSNRSSGKMGYSLAESARDAGHEVILISGPTDLPRPKGIQFHAVEPATEMLDRVLMCLVNIDIFVSVAAVSDYRPKSVFSEKHKKSKANWQIQLVKNPDILTTVSQSENRPFCVGFAAETNDVLRYGHEKLVRKCLDMIAVNDVSRGDIGMNHEYNALHVLWPGGERALPKKEKPLIARDLWRLIEERYDAIRSGQNS